MSIPTREASIAEAVEQGYEWDGSEWVKKEDDSYARAIGAIREPDEPSRKWTECCVCHNTAMCSIFGYLSDRPKALCFWCEENASLNRKEQN